VAQSGSKKLARRNGLPEPLVTDRLRAMLQAAQSGGCARHCWPPTWTGCVSGLEGSGCDPACRLLTGCLLRTFPRSCRCCDPRMRGCPELPNPLWTTLKVPRDSRWKSTGRISMAARQCAEAFKLMPAHRKSLCPGAVGHMRRRGLPPGSMSPEPAEAMEVNVVQLSDRDWSVLNGPETGVCRGGAGA